MLLDWRCLFLAPFSCNGNIPHLFIRGSLAQIQRAEEARGGNWSWVHRQWNSSSTQCWSWPEHILVSFIFRVPVVIWEFKSSGAGSNDPHWREHHLPPGTMQQSKEKWEGVEQQKSQGNVTKYFVCLEHDATASRGYSDRQWAEEHAGCAGQ